MACWCATIRYAEGDFSDALEKMREASNEASRKIIVRKKKNKPAKIASRCDHYFTDTSGVTEKPGRSTRSESSCCRLLKSIRTGMRCTTFT